MEQTTDSVVCVHADDNDQEKSKNAMKAALIISIFAKRKQKIRNKQEKEKRPHTDYLGLLGVQKSRRWLELTAYNF